MKKSDYEKREENEVLEGGRLSRVLLISILICFTLPLCSPRNFVAIDGDVVRRPGLTDD
ncbi:MAG: hypothetical protein H5T41_00020 [Methanomassiliicoccales archaeon]|nr:hypothetical protein [Methanomassiliicoccales archaeon]